MFCPSSRRCGAAFCILAVFFVMEGCGARPNPIIMSPTGLTTSPSGNGSTSEPTTTQSPTPTGPTQSPTPTGPTQSSTPTGSTQSPTPTGPTTTPSSDKCPGSGSPSEVTSNVMLFSDWPSMSAAGPREFLTNHLPAFIAGNNCLNVRVGDLVLTASGAVVKNWVDGDVTKVGRSTIAGGGQDFQSLLQQLEKSGTSFWINVIPTDNTWSTVCTGQPNVMACLFRFATTWNAFMKATAIAGIVVDGIDVRSVDLPKLIDQGQAAKGTLKLGLTVGLGVLNGAKNSYGTKVDMYLSFLLDFWVPSPEAYDGDSSEFASRKDKVQDMTNFLLSSISGESPLPRTDTRRYADDTALIWSPRHSGSTGCMYPLNNRACTDPERANELGSWSPKEAIELMKEIRAKVGSSGTRLGFYTLSLMPFTWLTKDYRKCFGRNC